MIYWIYRFWGERRRESEIKVNSSGRRENPLRAHPTRDIPPTWSSLWWELWCSIPSQRTPKGQRQTAGWRSRCAQLPRLCFHWLACHWLSWLVRGLVSMWGDLPPLLPKEPPSLKQKPVPKQRDPLCPYLSLNSGEIVNLSDEVTQVFVGIHELKCGCYSSVHECGSIKGASERKS